MLLIYCEHTDINSSVVINIFCKGNKAVQHLSSSYETTPHELWKVMFLLRPLQYLHWHKASILSDRSSHLNMNRRSPPPLSHKFQIRNSTSVFSFRRFTKAEVMMVADSRTRDFIWCLVSYSYEAKLQTDLCSGNLQLVWMRRWERVNIWRS